MLAMETKELGVKIIPDNIYTTEEAMRLLNIKSKTTIRERVKEGKLRRSKNGRTICFEGKDLLDFISRGKG
nr:MAG TPA: helix-turn-helix domain protein [Caudoviricetes sp.]